MKPLGIDLFCGLGGWSEGLIAEGFECIGFDIERHQYLMPEIDHDGDGSKGTNPVERRGWTQGCAVSLGMEGASAKPRTRLVEYPAQLVLQDVLTLHGSQFRDAALIVASPPCQEFSYMAMPWSRAKAIAAEYRNGVRDRAKLTALFDACFRIQREAIEAAGHFIPLVVENVRGAQPWVGRARWNYGSFHLFGDVPALMPMTSKRRMKFPADCGPRMWADRQVPRLNDGSVSPEAHAMHMNLGTKGIPHRPTGHWTNPEENGTKQGGDWFNASQPSISRLTGSKSNARKAASAAIARIPFALARHIAHYWKPR